MESQEKIWLECRAKWREDIFSKTRKSAHNESSSRTRRTASAASGKGLGTKAASFLRPNCLHSLAQLKAHLQETWPEDLRGVIAADSKGQEKGSY